MSITIIKRYEKNKTNYSGFHCNIDFYNLIKKFGENIKNIKQCKR